MVMDEDLVYRSCDDTLLNGYRLQSEESRKYPCLNLHSRKIKAKMLQGNQELAREEVEDISPRKLEEERDLEEEVRELGDFEIGEHELLPKHKARVHYIPEYLWEDLDTINPTNGFRSPNLQVVAVHQGELTRSEAEVMHLVRDIAVHKYTIKDLITAQDSDFMIRMLKLMFKNNGSVGRFPEPCTPNMARKIKGFFQATWRYLRYVKGVLCRTKKRTEAWMGKQQARIIILPQLFHMEIMRIAHDCNGHVGQTKTVQTILQRFDWPGMHKDVERYVSSCHKCQQNKSPKAVLSNFLTQIVSGSPNELMQMDHLKLPKNSTGHVGILEFLGNLR